MKTFAVFASQGKLKAIEVTNLSASSIDYLVGSINWYGINSNNEEEAFTSVIAIGYESRLLGT